MSGWARAKHGSLLCILYQVLTTYFLMGGACCWACSVNVFFSVVLNILVVTPCNDTTLNDTLQ